MFPNTNNMMMIRFATRIQKTSCYSFTTVAATTLSGCASTNSNRAVRCQQYQCTTCVSCCSKSSRRCQKYEQLPQQQKQRRYLTTESSLRILGLQNTNGATYDMKQIRKAYMKSAKRSHPDLQEETHKRIQTQTSSQSQQKIVQQQGTNKYYSNSARNNHNHNRTKNFNFVEVTDAYEYLKSISKNNHHHSDEIVTEAEEIAFRRGCFDILGLTAEQVEESKQNAAFRDWLLGNTTSAKYWRSFFSFHGGMAPMIRTLQISGQQQHNNNSTLNRRKRKALPRIR